MRVTHPARLSDARVRFRDHPAGMRRVYRIREGLTGAEPDASQRRYRSVSYIFSVSSPVRC